MKFFRCALSLFVVSVLIASTLCACKSYNAGAVIYYEVSDTPSTLDPQIASTDTELLMVRNLYEGLMRVDKDGNIVNGVISEYTYDEDTLTYTFTLSESALWSDGTSLTAYDFEYAFKRAVDPSTKCPFSQKFASILNAGLILSGTIDADNLGVIATDEITLIVNMSTDDPEFLFNLTTSAFMPCNKDFFEECKGQYGLNKDFILTNGSYRLGKWTKDSFAARLYRSEKYYGNFTAANSAVFLSYTPEKENIDKLSKSTVDIAYINTNQTEQANQSNLKYIEQQNKLWVIEFSNVFSYDIRRAFITAIDRETYTEKLVSGYKTAYCLFPQAVTGENLENVGILPYDISTAKSLFQSAIKQYENKRLPNTTLIYYNSEAIKEPINDIVGHWQKNLGAYINIQPSESLSEIKNALASSQNYIAVYPITFTDSNAYSLSAKLGYDFTGSAIKTPQDIQTNILADCKLAPIVFESSFIAHSTQIKEFNYKFGNGLTDFAYVKKK